MSKSILIWIMLITFFVLIFFLWLDPISPIIQNTNESEQLNESSQNTNESEQLNESSQNTNESEQLNESSQNTNESEQLNESSQNPNEPEQINEFNHNTNDSESSSNTRESEHMESEERVEPRNRLGKFQAGMNVLVYGHPEMSEAQDLFKHLRRLGVTSVAIVFPFVQTDWQADNVHTDPSMTPTLTEIKELIEAAHTEELSVMLRPILDEKSLMSSGLWRGDLRPKNPELWFDSYRALLLDYAELAQSANAEVFNIGTEFNSLQRNKYSPEWIRLIEDLREVYQGQIIYSFNWNTVNDIPSIEFVSLLDYVGIDAYYPLDAPDGASVEELKDEWIKWTSELEDLLGDKSIVITEAGMIPISGAHRRPYVWSIPNGKLDWQAQANYYEATYQAWRPIIKGIYWWTVTISQPDPDVIDYSPLGSRTESVIKRLFLNKPDKNSVQVQ